MYIVDCPSLSRQRASSIWSAASPTMMTGQRSLADMYAKEVLSAVEESATEVRLRDFLGVEVLTGLGIVLHCV